jgi:cysteine desulfurase family protein
MVYFDNAATSFPKPRRVRERVVAAMERYGANPGRSGHKLSVDTAVKVYETREALRQMFGAERVEDVAFTFNCTHAVNLVLKGLLKPGDHVVISDLEHNAIVRPIHALAAIGRASYSVAAVDELDDEKTVTNFAREIRPNTRLVACTHGSNVWGISAPVERIGRLCRERDILFMVDAAQTAGVLPLDTRASGIDFLCMPGHKSLYGPSGTGALVTPLGSALDTVFEGGTGSMSADLRQPLTMPDRLESGTINTMGVIGLGAGLEYVAEKTPAFIYGEEFAIASMIYKGLKSIERVRLYTKGFVKGRNLPVVSFNIDGLNSEEVTAKLSDLGFCTRGGLHCAPLAHRKMGTKETGAVRVSVGAFNTRRQAEQLLAAIDAIK